eukprot:SAG11_NODE_1982_length_3965_cov_11.055872_2_plen_65_part_00
MSILNLGIPSRSGIEQKYKKIHSWDLVGMVVTRQDWGLGTPVVRCQSEHAIRNTLDSSAAAHTT